MSDGEEIRKGWERLRTRGRRSVVGLNVLVGILALVSAGILVLIVSETFLQVYK